jgi:hypothetical protein
LKLNLALSVDKSPVNARRFLSSKAIKALLEVVYTPAMFETAKIWLSG